MISLRMSSRYFANVHALASRRPCEIRRASSLLSCAMRAIVRSTCVSSTRMPDSFAYCISTRSVIRRSSSCFSRTSGAGGVTFCAFICASDHARLLVDVVLRQRLVVDDRDHAIDEHALAMRCGDGGRRRGDRRRSGDRASSALREAGAGEAMRVASAAIHAARDGQAGARLGMRDLKIPGTDRRDRAATTSDRWFSGSRERCGAGVRAGWCRTARARSTRSAGRWTSNSSASVVVSRWPTTRSTQHPALYSTPATASSVLLSTSE